MTSEDAGKQAEHGTENLGRRVTAAAIGINLALGVLYSWSVIKKAIPPEWGWSDADKTLPYSVACLVFALTMIPAGRLQDRYGPRWIATAGGVATGLGLIFAGLATSVLGFILGFGILTGLGIGMGYAAATPAAVKWFPARRTGFIAGLVVAGFGLASVYIAPLADYLINKDASGYGLGLGVQTSVMIFGAAFLVVVCALSQLLEVPPAGYKPEDPTPVASRAAAPVGRDLTWQEMLRTSQFYLLWLMFAFAAGAGLMIIGSLAPIVKLQAGPEVGKQAFLFVAFLAVGNASGRVLAGWLSDIIGRRATMLVVFVLQAVIMFLLGQVSSRVTFVIVSVLLGANYGANLAVFPAVTKDYFGIKNFGVNYGWVFTAWGVGGLVLSQVSGRVFDATKSYDLAYKVAGGCLVAAAVTTFLLKEPKVDQAVARPDPAA